MDRLLSSFTYFASYFNINVNSDLTVKIYGQFHQDCTFIPGASSSSYFFYVFTDFNFQWKPYGCGNVFSLLSFSLIILNTRKKNYTPESILNSKEISREYKREH